MKVVAIYLQRALEYIFHLPLNLNPHGAISATVNMLDYCKRFLLLISVSLFVTTEVFANSLSLAAYLEEVKSANPNIEATKLRAAALKHKIKPNATWDDPFIAVGVDEIPFEGGGPRVRRYQVSQSIPFPGKLGARSEIAEKRAASSEFDAQTVIRQVEVMATQAFLRASYNSKAILLNESVQEILSVTTDSAKARYQTGDSNHHDWLLAKLELSVLKVEHLRLKRIQRTLTALLNELRNAPPDTPITIHHQDLLSSENEPEQTPDNLDTQPELLAWKAQNSAAEKELKLVKLSYAPDFVIQGMAMESTMNDPDMAEPSNWGVMVGMTLPLFFWRKQSELIHAAEKDQRATKAEYQSLQNRIHTEMADARQQLQASRDVVKLYQNDIIPLTHIAVKNAKSAYASKTLPIAQLLVALRSQRTQELELLASQMDVIVSKTRIQNLLSNPPVTKFAPARPTLFGADMNTSMGSGDDMDASPTINMGSGMSGPTRKTNGPDASGSSSGGMGKM